jgi:hypothetical protein
MNRFICVCILAGTAFLGTACSGSPDDEPSPTEDPKIQNDIKPQMRNRCGGLICQAGEICVEGSCAKRQFQGPDF